MAKILIVEDADYLRKMYKKMIELIGGHEVLEATNGREGLAIISSDQPDIILIDLLMPEMGGIELLTNIRDLDIHKNIAKVIISSNTSHDTKKRCFELGATFFLSKPLKKDKLSETIEYILNKKP